MSCLAVAAAGGAHARELTFDERVAAQKAIEQVYWNHRIWPKENPGPKPPLSSVLPDDAIRRKVEDSLRMSAQLDSFWHQPLTGAQLQAEIERMARSTKAPGTLRELFAALHDDPLLIAECLARPALAQRRVEAAFARDDRIHGAQRAALAAKLAGVQDASELDRLDGRHEEATFVVDEGAEGKRGPPAPGEIHLTREEWSRETHGLAASLGIAWPAHRSPSLAETPSRTPVGRVSGILDRGDRFAVIAVRARGASSVTVASVSWPKRRYSDWSRETMPTAPPEPRLIESPARGYAAPAAVGGKCVDDTWSATAGSELPNPRYGHTAVWTGSEMIVWGGTDGTNLLSSGGRFDPATDSWIKSSLVSGSDANVATPRSFHTAIWTGREMIVWGGFGTGAGNTGGRYDPASDSWAPSSLVQGTGANVPDLVGHAAVWTGSEMIVWGAGRQIVNSGGRYDPLTDTWAASSLLAGPAPNAPQARTAHTAVWTGAEMIVWGGQSIGGSRLNTGGRYDPRTDTWAISSLTSGSGANVPESRIQHTAVWTGSEMIIWGGAAASDNLGTGGRYDPTTDTWKLSSLTDGSGANSPAKRSGHTAIWTGSEMIVWGGLNYDGAQSSGGRYSPATDTWAACSLSDGSGANVPPPRLFHSAIWSGVEMIVWGGWDQLLTFDTGGRYDPVADTWANSSLLVGSIGNAPEARSNHTAVWTGAEAIVWGGSTDSELLNTGGRYDPSTDTWAMSSLANGTGANVPEARSNHTAIWTGTEMIVWGGWNLGPRNTGGRFNPTTDSWVATSLTSGSGESVPAAGTGHSAIWTGSEMIIWGSALYDPNPFGTGGRYDPKTDTWALSSLSSGSGPNVPSARSGHTAVWTGTEMIIWGGGSPVASTSTGGRYNPSTDSWLNCSLVNGSGPNVPTARSGHTAVWTGAEMIIWGGGGFNTGGRYNAAADTWSRSALTDGSAQDTPDGRFDHTAVWTGSEMVVWGGVDIHGQPVDTGGRFRPSKDSWAPSSLRAGSGANTPTPRSGHVAAWTDAAISQIFIWGGGSPSLHSGGLYCADCDRPWYRDADGDGHGDPLVSVVACDAPEGYVPAGDDCDDSDPEIHPGAPERCNRIDDNCNGVVDDGANAACDDANVCTNDACSLRGACVHSNNTVACDDQNPCTTSDHCAAGACVGGPATICDDDGDICTADVCDALRGCIGKSINMDTSSFSKDRVDGRDLTVLANAWNSCPGDPRYKAIANLDNVPTGPEACVGMVDFHIFMTAFGHSCPSSPTP